MMELELKSECNLSWGEGKLLEKLGKTKSFIIYKIVYQPILQLERYFTENIFFFVLLCTKFHDNPFKKCENIFVSTFDCNINGRHERSLKVKLEHLDHPLLAGCIKGFKTMTHNITRWESKT